MFMTAADAAEELCVSKQTVYRMLHDGRLDGMRIGTRGLRVKTESVKEFIERNRVVDMGDYGGIAPGADQPELFGDEGDE